MGNFILYNPNFGQNFRSQAPKIWNFQFTRPHILTFSVNKTPNFEFFSSQDPKFWNFQFIRPPFGGNDQFTSPTLQKSWPHTPTLKKGECLPRDLDYHARAQIVLVFVCLFAHNYTQVTGRATFNLNRNGVKNQVIAKSGKTRGLKTALFLNPVANMAANYISIK